MGYLPGKVKDIAVSMGLDVETVVIQMANDYIEFKWRNIAFPMLTPKYLDRS